METDTDKFPGFPEPRSNFTPIPNVYLDSIMHRLKEGEMKVMEYIFRRTYGWQKDVDCISLTQFESGIVTRTGKRLDHGTGLARSTIVEALKSVVQKGYILRFISGRGSTRRSFYFLHTETNRKLVRTLEREEITIEQVFGLKSKPRLGAKSEPTLRLKSKPTPTPKLGSKFGPTRKSDSKKNVQKKAAPAANAPPTPNHENVRPDPKREAKRSRSKYADTWQNVCEAIRKKVQPQSFSRWIKPLFLESVNGTSIVLNVPDVYTADWVREHYEWLFLSVLSEVLGTEIKHLNFHTEESSNR